ncbi:DNA polymerase III subunit gamma/tau [Clostridium sp. 'deep sea']|uniref:DNA polymerase III subunit gamma/tau n=1 Tax=Clostridium sp. 'deep sea' TaxID=2779445 RepID=UPI0018965438|nr:DNA polymerase III subunit gamma/tau [Clostridium sp. 'deep sea']QOR33631.1 DNA polymerase III subunit gamma/tau [Clostridium sp. 'deep sea']
MGYQALYRQLRPLKFEDVLGQAHITKTLSNAVKNNFIAHAYLFAGPRGVGKTSTARILARAINCLHQEVIVPCNECLVCKNILESRSLDVIEIDAASNNGVDEIRDLREKVKYAPANCRYKVYIIDEVHMLSTAAFNALLKTLEEPPAHVIFILATTEAHKIPATIKSRCQRFDFHRINKDFIKSHIQQVATDLGATISKEALDLITRASDGAMRDAISILDQCLAYSENNINLKIVMDLLGAVDDKAFYLITESIISNNVVNALEQVAKVYDQGHSLEQFLVDYLHYLRSLLELQVGINNNEIVLEDISLVNKQAKDISRDHLYVLIHSIVKAVNDIKYAKNQRLVVELAILESQYITGFSLTELAARVTVLEKQTRNGEIVSVSTSKQEEQVNNISYSDFKKEIEQQVVKNETANEQAVIAEPLVSKSYEPIKQTKSQISLSSIERNWNDILAKVKEQDVITNALLKNAKPLQFENMNLVLQFSDDFHKDQVTSSLKKNIIETVLESVLGDKVNIKGVLQKASKPKKNEVVEKPKVDIVQTAIEIFSGKIVSKEN